MKPRALEPVLPWSLLFAALLGCLAGLQFWLNASMEGNPLPLADILARHVTSWLSWGLLAPLVLRAARDWPVRGVRWRRHVARHLAVSLALACVHRPLHVWWAWYPFWGRGPAWDFVRDFSFFSLFTDVAIWWVLVGAWTVFDQQRQLRRRDVRDARLQGELSEARRLVLEQQLRPHFLFNTLNALRTLVIDGKPREAAAVIERLSGVLRTVLAEGTPPLVTLREEWRLATPYVELMQIRHGMRLDVQVELPADVADLLVPRLILQPLLENAFLHGLDGRADAGRVGLRARRDGTRLIVEIHDDGPGPGGDTDPGHGLGLRGVRGRLHTLYGTEGRLELRHEPGGGCCARLEIPARLELGLLSPSQPAARESAS